MKQYYTVKDLIKRLQDAGIKIHRANIFLKIKSGVLRPQAYSMIGNRKYPKYSSDYVDKLIATATIETKLDWNKVKQVTDAQIDILQKI